MAVSVGGKAPDFMLPADDGSVFRLSDHRGRIVVLYFYPRAFTPGCTREAARFNELLDEFEGLGAVVVGVSTDPVDRIARFKEKLGLRFTLLSDAEGRVASLYGVLRAGRKRPSAERATFIIDGEGVVRRIIRNVRPAERHVDLALEEAKKLAG
jgi:peroxiredoxin Q/BCP